MHCFKPRPSALAKHWLWQWWPSTSDPKHYRLRILIYPQICSIFLWELCSSQLCQNFSFWFYRSIWCAYLWEYFWSCSLFPSSFGTDPHWKGFQKLNSYFSSWICTSLWWFLTNPAEEAEVWGEGSGMASLPKCFFSEGRCAPAKLKYFCDDRWEWAIEIAAIWSSSQTTPHISRCPFYPQP